MLNYNDLINKPKINNVEITGAKTFDDFNIYPIKFDSNTRYLYTILQDGTRVNIKEVADVSSS